jgi:hypothetical protein
LKPCRDRRKNFPPKTKPAEAGSVVVGRSSRQSGRLLEKHNGSAFLRILARMFRNRKPEAIPPKKFGEANEGKTCRKNVP